MRRILLLADASDLEPLTRIFWEVNDGARVIGASTAAELDAATQDPGDDLRLVGFCTGVIVPSDVLARLPGPAYNFHPGPPEYRGIYPSVFALYDGATRFGATLHELTEQVDSGPIIATEYADIPPHTDRLWLETMARRLVTDLLRRMAEPLLELDGPLPPNGEAWSGPAWSRADFDALCHLPDDVDEAEFNRRHHALGEGPEHALYFERFGRRFTIQPLPGEEGSAVYKGGKRIN